MVRLLYHDPDGRDQVVDLGATPIAVGRAAECEIRSDDPRISRMHARFWVETGAVWVEDLGSANGVFIGASKVTRGLVPMGEVVLVGALLFRIVPPSGEIPAPTSVHDILSQWLVLERKSRSAVEAERDAFAERVGQIHQELQHKLAAAPPAHPSSNVIEDGLRRALAAAQDRIAAYEHDEGQRAAWSESDTTTSQTPILSQLKVQLGEAVAAKQTAEHARAEVQAEVLALRRELGEVGVRHATEVEFVRGEVASLQEAKHLAETQLGIRVAHLMADADARIDVLTTELTDARILAAGGGQADADTTIAQLRDALADATGRAEVAVQAATAAQIRAQDAERSLADALDEAHRDLAARTVTADTATAAFAAATTALAATERRLAAAEALAKGMTKDLTEALRRSAEADSKRAAAARDLDQLRVEVVTLTDELARVQAAALAAEQAAATSTRTVAAITEDAAAPPHEGTEELGILQEAIDSLRANMRAASDETAVMPPSDSVTTVADAVSQAADHVERARAALRILVGKLGA